MIIKDLNYSIIDNILYMKSEKKGKKLKAYVNKHWIHFGNTNYENYYDKTHLLEGKYNHLDDKRRDNYIKRASKIRDKNGNLTMYDINSSNHHSIKILW
jgi:hypothetical protein